MKRTSTWIVWSAVFLGVARGGMPAEAEAGLVLSRFDLDRSLAVPRDTVGVQSVFGQFADPSAIGGYLDIFAQRNSANRGAIDVDINLSAPDSLTFSAGKFTSGFASIQFDGNDNSPLVDPYGLGMISLIDPGGSPGGFRFGASTDLGGDITIHVYSGTTGGLMNVSSATVFVPSSPGFLDFLVPFGAFTVSSGLGADFARVGAIELLLGMRDGSDIPDLDLSLSRITIEGLTVVPEPGSLGLCASGILVGLGVWCRRRAHARRLSRRAV